MFNNYIFLKNFFNQNEINMLKMTNDIINRNESDSKVGVTVQKDRKIRKDKFFNEECSKKLDSFLLDRLKPIIYDNFNKNVKYREGYKIGKYLGDEKGFYNPHTDKQGGMDYRDFSVLVCLSKSSEYIGGEFKFVDYKKEFKFDIGDVVIFKSELLHAVEPVTSGIREVLITFFWTEESNKKLKEPIFNTMYNNLPKQLIEDITKNPALIDKLQILPIQFKNIMEQAKLGNLDINSPEIREKIQSVQLSKESQENLEKFKLYIKSKINNDKNLENLKIMTNNLNNLESIVNKKNINFDKNEFYNFETFKNYDSKIISFSLWGDSEIYNYGMLENILIAKEYLPEFKIYIYFNNTVLLKTLDFIKKLTNVVLIFVDNDEMSAKNSLWRYKPCFESDSLVFIRDNDSIINERDIFVIKDFMNSRFNISSIKDNPAHFKYCLCAGLWGCKNGILKKYNLFFKDYSKGKLNIRGIDQDLLISIFFKNIEDIQLYIDPQYYQGVIFEKNIKFIQGNSNHIGSINHSTPKAFNLMNETVRQLSIKRFYEFGTRDESFRDCTKLITIIPHDSGPGNQIISIKECLILSKLLNKICLIPPIREHYIHSNNTFYNFNEIFNLNLNNAVIDDNKSSILNSIDNKKRYNTYKNYFLKKLYHEDLIESKNNSEELLNTCVFKSVNDLEELKSKGDNILILKCLFNNLYISESGKNGEFNGKLNSNFENIYKEICSKWDYSDLIKQNGNDYIKKNFNNSEFNAIHIRLSDKMDNSLEYFTNNDYNNNRLIDLIKNLKIKSNKPLFIACNNVKFLKDIGINENFMEIPHKYQSFIEQYICSCSSDFYYLNLEHTRYNDVHNRSTWTSFVIDYREYFKNINRNFNLRN